MSFIERPLEQTTPGLLVSVRSAEEALAALAGGADVIDVKEPSRGALGAADRETIDQIVHAVDRRAPVTIAAGELLDRPDEWWDDAEWPGSISLIKLGLAGCADVPDWASRWQRIAHAMRRGVDSADTRAVAVVYADWKAAGGPPPDEIHSAALAIGCPALLVDTWNKSAGNLLNYWPPNELQAFVERVRASGQIIVLAGSLRGGKLLAAARLRPHLIGVRGAACDGGRSDSVSAERVSNLQQLLVPSGLTNQEPAGSPTCPLRRAGRYQDFS